MCSHCEKPFEGRRHYEKKGQAYCERDYKAVRQSILPPLVCCYVLFVLYSSLAMSASLVASHVVAMVSWSTLKEKEGGKEGRRGRGREGGRENVYMFVRWGGRGISSFTLSFLPVL